MAVGGLVGEAWILVRPYTAEFGPQLRRDVAAQVAVADSGLASGGGLVGPKTVAATERQAATAGEKAAKAFGGRFSALGRHAISGATTALIGGVAIGEVGKMMVDTAVSYQDATAQIRANTGQTQGSVDALGQAFLDTAKKGESTFKAGDIAKSYGAVAGQLKTVQGHVLSTTAALAFMRSAEDDAEASGSDLNSTTGALAATMQAFHVPIKNVSTEADILFNVSRSLNVPLTSVSTAVDRLHSRLGVASPSLSDTGTLMVSMGKAGVQGQRGLMVVSSAMSTLLSQSTKSGKATKASATEIAQAHIAEQVATDNVIKARVNYGTTSEQYVIAVERQKVAHQKYLDVQKKVPPTTSAAQQTIKKLGLEVYDAHGKFVGMHSIIAQLGPRLAKMSDAQRTLTLQTLFGKQAAAVMGQVIGQGVKGWDASAKSVTAHGSAEKAAADKAKTLHGQTKILGAQVDALAITYGTKLIPKVTSVVHYFTQHQGVAETLAGIIGGVLVLAIGRYVGKLVWSTAQTTIQMGKQIAQWTGLSKKATKVAGDVKGASTKISKAGGTVGKDLETAGSTASTEMKTGAATAGSEMAAGGTTAKGEMAAGGATAEGEMAAGGATAEGEMAAGGAAAEGELAAGGATAEGELAAGGTAAAGELAAGGLAAGAAGAGAAGAEAAGAGAAAGAGEGLLAGGGAAALSRVALPAFLAYTAYQAWTGKGLPGQLEHGAGSAIGNQLFSWFGDKGPTIGLTSDAQKQQGTGKYKGYVFGDTGYVPPGTNGQQYGKFVPWAKAPASMSDVKGQWEKTTAAVDRGTHKQSTDMRAMIGSQTTANNYLKRILAEQQTLPSKIAAATATAVPPTQMRFGSRERFI